LWYAGDAVFNTGTTGNGFIDIYSIRGVKSAAQHGPTIVGNMRNSATFNDWSEHWGIGNLNGLYGYGTTTYGAAFGRYANNSSFLTADATNGIRIMQRAGDVNTQLARWAMDGSITIGEVAASRNNVVISADALSLRNNVTERIGLTAAGVLTIRDSSGNAVITLDAAAGAEITRRLTMPGANSAIAIGATPPTSTTAGTGIWIDRTGMYGLASNVQQAIFSATTGEIIAGAGDVRLNSGGLRIVAHTSWFERTAIKWLSAGDHVNFPILQTYALAMAASRQGISEVTERATFESHYHINARSPADRLANIRVQAASGAPGSDTITEIVLAAQNSTLLSRITLWSGLVHVANGPLYIGDASTGALTGEILYTGRLLARRGGVNYNSFVYVPLASSLTNTGWDGDARAVGTYILTPAMFGYPATARAVALQIAARWSAAAEASYMVVRNPVSGGSVIVRAHLANMYFNAAGIANCNALGEFIVTIGNANATNTFVEIVGYFL
jgi:hypothetical protein